MTDSSRIAEGALAKKKSGSPNGGRPERNSSDQSAGKRSKPNTEVEIKRVGLPSENDDESADDDIDFEELSLKRDDDSDDRLQFVSLSQETRRRYLNYAMSVIQSRALPDVRDGLKPVQRRILYVMYELLHLMPTAKTKKCANIVGQTIANFHPHGDVAVYEALCRLAQDFTYRYPLADGQGNFGSVMGLPPAAQRYTEARLTAIAEQLMTELRYDTVEMRPNYDGEKMEPVVMPARFPNLVVNGTQGIAVGMATSIPPHNLGEVIKACVHLIDNSEVSVAQIMRYIKGPDFPLGGRIVTDRTDLRIMYEEGRGSIKVRGEWKLDKEGRKTVDHRIQIYSVPYGVETGPLQAEIGAVIQNRKLPQLLEVSDLTDDEHGLRLILDLKPGSDPEAVMAYLYKHTSLEQNFGYNATCLIPNEQGMLVPRRLNLVEMLQYFLTFRQETVRKRFQYLLAQLEKRIHILEGFEIIFDGLDRALKIIRNSDGKQDAAVKLMKEFPLDEVQTMAILELQLYRISKLEIDDIRAELAEKQKEAKRIRSILNSEAKLWDVVKTELEEIAADFGNERRTGLGSSEEMKEFAAETYIVRENTNVVLTKDGWIKRVGRLAKVESTRVREGDSVIAVVPGSTIDSVIFFASDGVAYTMPIEQVPPSSGYGDPLSKYVKLSDGVSLITALSTDSRFTPADETADDPTSPPHLIVVTADGQVMKVAIGPYRAASTKSGRKYCRLRTGDRVVHVELIRDQTTMFLASREARLIHFSLEEVPVLSGPGIGVKGIKMDDADSLLGAKLLARPSDSLRVKNENGTELSFGQMKYTVTGRGGKGVKTSQRSNFSDILAEPIQLVDWGDIEANTPTTND